MLLRHASESLAALQDGIDAARIGARSGRFSVIAVADRCITPGILAAMGALEIAAHGWDVSRVCGDCRPIPSGLATDLLTISPLLVSRDGGTRCSQRR